MSLPINISQLINGKVVEWERIEFKAGWNPIKVVHSICAFANDAHNWGGGYLVIGIQEQGGRPVLPPVGLDLGEIDSIQRELVEICYKIEPRPTVIPEPVEFMGSHILVIWVPGGETRPYKAPVHLGKNELGKAYYIRTGSVTRRADGPDEQLLLSLAAKVPFDDRICHAASLDDLDLGIIREYLRDIDSGISDEQARTMDFKDLCESLQIIGGTPEFIRPKNVGLLFFSRNPEKYIPYARIEIVHFLDEVGDNMEEKIFHGPIHKQLTDALHYLETQVIRKRITKIDGQAEAPRTYNYPFAALEENLSNAVYHKSWDDRNPIEVRVNHDSIQIYSMAGPMPPITNNDLKKERVVNRNYRNRRIGDFLKELDMTEGRSTGFPKIYEALKRNGSPAPIFETDDKNQFFLATIRIHPLFLDNCHDTEDDVINVVEELSERQRDILKILRGAGTEVGVINGVIKSYETTQSIADKLHIGFRTVQRNLRELKDKGLVRRIGANKNGFWEVQDI